MNYESIVSKIGRSEDEVHLSVTLPRAFILLCQLQLALRHPGNDGEGALITYQTAKYLSDAICLYVPEARELIDMGWNPAYDMTREYFEAEFPFREGDRHADE